MGWTEGVHAVLGASSTSITWWQMSIRAVIIFVVGLAMVRLAGGRAFGRQTPLDIVLAVLIGSSLSRALTGNARFFQTIIAMAVLVAVYWASLHIAARSSVFARVTEGRPKPLVSGGKPDTREMRRNAVSESDLNEAARLSGLRGADELESAALERGGKISVRKG